MRFPIQDQIRRPVEQSFPADFPAPTLGWNTLVNVASTPPGYALKMRNFIPYPDKCVLRNGSTNHVTGFTATKEVESLIVFQPSGSGAKLFGATDEGIFDVTAAGTVGSVASAATNGRWQWVNFANSATNYVCCVNGVDDFRYYNGSTWSTVATFGSLNTNTLVGIEVYQQRLFFVAVNSKILYYLPAGAVTGTAAASALNVEQLMKKGGSLQATGTWTIDSGSGLDDKFVVVTSEGEVILFQGTDPSSVNTWSYIGTYYVGRPIGRRCLIKMGGDLLILTERGLFPLSRAIQSSTIEPTVALSRSIEPSITAAAKDFFSTFGWQIELFPRDQILVLNIPGTAKKQFVMQLQTQGWCEFSELPANCWAVFNGELYFGTTTKVMKAQNGYADLSAAIVGVIEYAYSKVDGSTRTKVPVEVLPLIETSGNVPYTLGVSADFTTTESFNLVEASPTGVGGIWGTGVWDTDFYGGDRVLSKSWTTVPATPGAYLSPYLAVSTAIHSVAWIGMQMLYKRGTPLS